MRRRSLQLDNRTSYDSRVAWAHRVARESGHQRTTRVASGQTQRKNARLNAERGEVTAKTEESRETTSPHARRDAPDRASDARDPISDLWYIEI